MKKMKMLIPFMLVLCLAFSVLSPAAFASEAPTLGGFLERYGPSLGDKLGDLGDWLGGKVGELAPELRETLRDVDTESLISDLKGLAGETKDMSDEELRAAIVALAEKHGVHLVDTQVEQLMTLCRTLEKVDAKTLKEKAQSLKPELETPAGLRGILDSLRQAARRAMKWFSEKLGGLLG